MRPWAFALSSLMNLSLRRVCVSSSMRLKNSFVVAFIDWLIGCESMGVWVEPRLGSVRRAERGRYEALVERGADLTYINS